MLSRSHTLLQAPLSLNPKYGSRSYCCPPFISSAAVNGFCRSFPGTCSVRNRRIPLIRTVVAAQPFDYDCEANPEKLKLAIVGFGEYGQFIARGFARQGHPVLAYSPSDYSATAESIGASFFSDPHDLFEEHPDVIVLCTSIDSTMAALYTLPFHRLSRSTLLACVLSVEQFPPNVMLQCLPPDFDILCTDPMCRPECRKDGWMDLRFVFDKVRIGSSDERQKRCDRFLEIFKNKGARW